MCHNQNKYIEKEQQNSDFSWKKIRFVRCVTSKNCGKNTYIPFQCISDVVVNWIPLYMSRYVRTLYNFSFHFQHFFASAKNFLFYSFFFPAYNKLLDAKKERCHVKQDFNGFKCGISMSKT